VVEAIDPAGGRVTASRNFTYGDANAVVDFEVNGPQWRGAFNADFTELAVTSAQQADGTTTAGYVDASGNYMELAQAKGGYAAWSAKAVGFDPATGNFWYEIPQANNGNGQYGYASQVNGHVVSHVAPQLPVSGPAWVPAPNGSKENYNIYLPGGTEVMYAPLEGYQVGPYGKVGTDSSVLPMSPTGAPAWPVVAASAKSFIAMDLQSSQIYFCTVGAKSVSVKPLLPQSTRTITGEVAVNPSGDEVAFIATSGSQYSLYTVSLTGAGQPQLVTNIDPAITGLGLKLVAWVS
jgi:hypothetical protein